MNIWALMMKKRMKKLIIEDDIDLFDKVLKKFNYGDKCDDCVKKIELVHELNIILDYMSPSEELKKETLKFTGLDELKLDIIISHLLNENLIVLGSKGIYLADVKALNNFFQTPEYARIHQSFLPASDGFYIFHFIKM